MRGRLRRKLRKEIIQNSEIIWLGAWSGYLHTKLDGVDYYGDIHTMIAFSIIAEDVGKEIEHRALSGYIKRHKVISTHKKCF